MTATTDSITSFAICGVPMSASEFNPYLSTTDSRGRSVGFKFEDNQGNIYRWASFSAACGQGTVVSPDLSLTSLVDSDNIVVAPASAQTTSDGTIGSRFVEVTLSGIAADAYAGGLLVVTDDTGEGYTYPIESNTATGDPASGKIRLTLKYPLQVALDGTSDIAIAPSPYKGLKKADSTDEIVVGASVASQAADDYGWVLTKGQIGILQDGPNIVVGDAIKVGSVAGSVNGSGTATNDNVFGICVVAGDDTGYCIAKINCE